MDGTALTEALARRDVLKLRFGMLKGAARAASGSVAGYRYGRTEIKRVPTVSVADLHRRADQLTQLLRELDVAVQDVNGKSRALGRALTLSRKAGEDRIPQGITLGLRRLNQQPVSSRTALQCLMQG